MADRASVDRRNQAIAILQANAAAAGKTLHVSYTLPVLPTGLTRHLIQGRALRTNYPLSELKSDDSLEVKNERLKTWLQRKLGTKEIRYYGEATYAFDE